MSETVRIAYCREPKCDAAIVWMITPAGKHMPVDADSVDEATLEWQDGKPMYDSSEHTAHWGTCKDPDRFKR